MKQTTTIIIIIILACTAAKAEECTDQIYKLCETYSYTYENETTTAKVLFTIQDGIGQDYEQLFREHTAINGLYLYYDCIKGNCYYIEGLESWDNICTNTTNHITNCPPIEAIKLNKTGFIILAEEETTYKQNPTVINIVSGNRSWAWAGSGYLREEVNKNVNWTIRVISEEGEGVEQQPNKLIITTDINDIPKIGVDIIGKSTKSLGEILGVVLALAIMSIGLYTIKKIAKK